MSEPVPALVAGHGSAIVLTTRLNQLSVSTTMSLAQAGFCPVVALMGQSGARRRRQVLAEYGWLYSVEQLASAIARKLWLQWHSGALASIKVVELPVRDWTALISSITTDVAGSLAGRLALAAQRLVPGPAARIVGASDRGPEGS